MFNVTINNGEDNTKKQITRFMDQDSGYCVAIPSQPDPSFSMADFNDTELGNFFSRPLKIGAFTWSQSVNFFQEFDPWSLFFNNPRNINRVSNFNLLRCKLCVKILINGNGFHYGRLLASYNPRDTAQTFILNRALVPLDNIEASQRLSFILDPTTSMGGMMELPFVFEKNALSVPNTDWNVMGKVSIRLLNPLKHANGAVDTVQVSVFAWAEDVELAVPTSVEPGSITPQSGEYEPQADEYETPTKEDAPVVSTALSTLSNIAQDLASSSVLAPYARPLSIAAGSAAQVAKAVGFSRPRELTSVKPLMPLVFGNMGNANAEDNCLTMAMDQKQSLNVDSRTMGLDGSDEMLISSICARESYLTTFSWPTASSTETLLWNCRVTPQLYDVTGSPQEFHFTPMGYVANAFRFWKGSIQYRFQIVASSFHKGRIKIVWDPVATVSNEYNTAYTQVVDIAHTRDFAVNVGWGANVPFLEQEPIYDNTSPYFSTSALSPSYSGNFNGVISVFVVNDLTVPDSTINNDIQINVFVKSEDIEFRFPTFRIPQNMCLSPFQPQSGEYIPQAGSPDVAGTPMESHPEDAPVESIGQTSLVTSQDTFFGDPVVSLRQLFKRYMVNFSYYLPVDAVDRRVLQLFLPAFPLTPGYVPNSDTAMHMSSATQQYNYSEMTFMSWFAPCFLAWRGSVRHKYHIERSGTGARNEYAKVSLTYWTDALSSGQSGPVIYESVTGSPDAQAYHLLVGQQFGASGMQGTDLAMNPVINVEVPYLKNERFSIARSGSRDGEPAVIIDTLQAATVNTIVTDYVAAGEDFTLACFVSTPVIYSYIHPVPP